jgi:predicted acylesterase/phospholipase RssA
MVRWAILPFVLVLGACTHMAPKPTPGCAYTAYPLRIDSGPAARSAASDFEGVLRAAMSAPAPPGPGLAGPERPSVLILSGGSQNGAFGAGFFAGMVRVPDYKLVTGVSTGALQSTFLFLANTPVPADRTFPAYFGTAPGSPHTNAGDLALAYSIERERDLIKVGGKGQLGGVIRGSIGEFGPLRETLRGLLSPDTLRAVGAAYRPNPAEGRRLLVGVTDVNDGAGYAIDLTELASRLLDGRQPYATVSDCYIDALVASSSVPLAALPVTLERRDADGTINRHLYVDGGARFGVFWSQLGEVLAGGMQPEVTLIVNGSLYGKPWLDKSGKPQTNWSALTLALRTVSILENQVYRFSVDNVSRAASGGGSIRMAFISNDNLRGWPEPMDFPWEGRTCGEWNDMDNLEKPTEFHPRYMRCLLEYGRARGAALAWNRAD